LFLNNKKFKKVQFFFKNGQKQIVVKRESRGGFREKLRKNRKKVNEKSKLKNQVLLHGCGAFFCSHSELLILSRQYWIYFSNATFYYSGAYG
jgi:hypothetical protein